MRNGESIALEAVPHLDFGDFGDAVVAAVEGGCRVSAFFARPVDNGHDLVAVISDPDASRLTVLASTVLDDYPSLTPRCPQLHWFEREIAETWGLVPDGHPRLKPVRRWREGNFYQVEGDAVHEVAVGPVHAGVIEPGHFRFQCHGEKVIHLEIALGYQHRGVERALSGGPGPRSLHYAETLAGDTTIGHGMAYCQVVEALAGTEVSARAEAIRGVALELERLAAHVGDLGALAGDVGFLPVAASCGRLRGEFLNLTANICGNRFGRGVLRPGGVGFDLDRQRVALIVARLDAAFADTERAERLLFEAPSVLARFMGTGRIWRSQSQELGLVGPAARACGRARDVRFEFPTGVYRSYQLPVGTWHTGDVFARAYVRVLEIRRSVDFIREVLAELPEGPIRGETPVPLPGRLAVSLVEGWRGEVCHVALTDRTGKFAAYKVVDPSFHNWFGLAMAMRDQEISDFPLCNKSFDLSYCGHDL